MIFQYPTAAGTDSGDIALPLASRCADGLCRGVLVLVFYSRRCRRRGQFPLSSRASRFVLFCRYWRARLSHCSGQPSSQCGSLTCVRPCCSGFTSCRRRSCSVQFRGPSLPICFSNPQRPCKSEWRKPDGSRSNLPAPADKPAVFGSARRLPQNY